MLTITLLQALPNTPLVGSSHEGDRLADDPAARKQRAAFCGRTTMWVSTVAALLATQRSRAACSSVFHHQVETTYVKRGLSRPARGKLNWANLSAGLVRAFGGAAQGFCRNYRKRSGGPRAMRCAAADRRGAPWAHRAPSSQFTREALRGEAERVRIFGPNCAIVPGKPPMTPTG